MAKEIKFSEEELQSLNELSQGYQNIQAAFGQMKVQHILAEQQLSSPDPYFLKKPYLPVPFPVFQRAKRLFQRTLKNSDWNPEIRSRSDQTTD